MSYYDKSKTGGSYWDKRAAEPQETEQEPEQDSLEQLEAECVEELDEVKKGFRERMQAENKRFRDMCDTEYWFCVCFTSREQKEEFLRKIGIATDIKYIEGKEMAAAYRKAIKTPDLEFAKVQGKSKEYLELSRNFGE